MAVVREPASAQMLTGICIPGQSHDLKRAVFVGNNRLFIPPVSDKDILFRHSLFHAHGFLDGMDTAHQWAVRVIFIPWSHSLDDSLDENYGIQTVGVARIFLGFGTQTYQSLPPGIFIKRYWLGRISWVPVAMMQVSNSMSMFWSLAVSSPVNLPTKPDTRVRVVPVMTWMRW